MQGTHTSANILLVDDSATSRMLLDAILRGSGYKNILTAPSGTEALDILRTRSSQSISPAMDLVLMDINMPDMNGISVVRTIKQDELLADIPIIMVTVSDERSSLEQAFVAGAIDYVNKPVNKLELLARVRTVLKFREEMERRKVNELGLMDMTSNLQDAYRKLEEMNENLESRVQERTSRLEDAYQEFKELDRMKTAFLSNVSHELRTPLTSVLGFASIIRSRLLKVVFPALERPGSVPQKSLEKAVSQIEANLDILLTEAKRLTTRINDVLDITRMESGEMEWGDGPVRIDDVLQLAQNLMAPLFQEKELAFELSIKNDLPEIRGDKDKLLQAVMNLLSNAVKFTDKGKVVCSAEYADNEILISIKDTGKGFQEAEYATVFEKFKQLGDDLTGKPQGVGLGVPICSYIIEHHGGRLWAQSTPDMGSTFWLTLPVTKG